MAAAGARRAGAGRVALMWAEAAVRAKLTAVLALGHVAHSTAAKPPFEFLIQSARAPCPAVLTSFARTARSHR